MDKGIRPAANAKFLELIPARVNTREGNTAFRKTVIAFIMEQFGATLASAATHYNHAFINARTLAATNAELAQQLVGLGRPEDKKGGRKKVVKVVQATAAPAAQAEESLSLGELVGLVDTSETPAAPQAQITNAAAAVGPEHLQQEPETPAVTLYTVYKEVKGTEVATGLTEEQADELIAKAAAAKKSKLAKRAQ